MGRRTAVFLTIVMAGLVAVASVLAQPRLVTVRAGVLPGLLAGAVAYYKEYGERHGLRYDVLNFGAGVPILQALVKGDIEMGCLPHQHLIRAIEEGMDIVAVAGCLTGAIELTVDRDLPVGYGDWAGLRRIIQERKARGQPLTIASSQGSYPALMLRWQLKNNGIDPDRDVKIVNVAAFPDHGRVLQMKQVEMVSTMTLFAGPVRLQGQAKVFWFPYDAPSGNVNAQILVARRLVRERPDTVQRIVTSHVEIFNLLKDRRRLIEVEAKQTGRPVPLVQELFKNQAYLYEMDVNANKGMAKMMHEVGWTKTDLGAKVEEHFDFSFLERATRQDRRSLSVVRWAPEVTR
ncbi:MAG: ABC transporter substrate-binding protein [Deltaproteobacteria bacterium]|nr:ABC transporter substrate-binding protein [Deltaproteobacteria bacterium]